VSLADLIQAEKKKPGTKCAFGYIFDTITPEDADDLRKLLDADPRVVTHAMIHRGLTTPVQEGGYGFVLGRDTVRRHRGKECSCVAR